MEIERWTAFALAATIILIILGPIIILVGAGRLTATRERSR